MQLDLDFVRSQFPAFSKPEIAAQSFFENAGGSFACGPVIDRLTRFYVERKVQPYADYDASRLGGEEMDEARNRLSALMGIAPDELSFGPSTTQNVYVLAQAFREWLKPGEAIIVTNQDHEANSGAWRRLADHGIEVREWQVDAESGILNPEDLSDLLNEKVRLVAFPHCSNVVGEINDVAAIAKQVHEAGAYVCVDGVSYAPHGIPNVDALGADIYMFSAYKTYGPHQGVMAVRRELGMQLPNQAHHFNAGSLYKRFTPAGPDHAQVAASAGMVDYFEALAAHHGHTATDAASAGQFVHDLMRAHEVRLLQPLLDYLGDRNSVRLLGTRNAQNRAPTVAIQTGNDPVALAAKMVNDGVNVAGGDFYAVRPLTATGIDPDKGVLRMSFVHYTSEADVTRLIEALDRHL